LPDRGAPNDVVSLHITAPPERIYALISDIAQMGRWSPETYRTRWLGSADAAVPGARFKGYNRWHWVRWSTTVEIDVADPGRELTFWTVFRGQRKTRWSYTFAPRDGGTDVTETRTRVRLPLPEYSFERLMMRGHEDSFKHGMLATLQRLKDAAEAV